MKYTPVWIILFLIAGGLGWAWMNGINPLSQLLGMGSALKIQDSVKERKLELFMPPKRHYKVMFPGAPEAIQDTAKMYQDVDIPGHQYYVADKEIQFHAAEAEGSMVPGDYALTAPTTPANIGNVHAGLYTSIGTQLGKVSGNNEAVSFQMPVDSPEMKAQTFIDNEAKRLTKYLGGTIVSMQPVAGAGGRFPGREVRGSINKTGKAFRLREYWDYTGRRLFSVAAVGTQARVDSPQTSKFIDSIEMWP
jgi:hypothetical protein